MVQHRLSAVALRGSQHLERWLQPAAELWRLTIVMDRKIRKKKKEAERLPVDPSKLNMGGSYSLPPEYYSDIEFQCRDCRSRETWTAKDQKW
jgi:hypothetical protein